MPTPAYVPLNPNTPAGITQAPDAYSASDLANVRALRDAVVCGFVPGWSYHEYAERRADRLIAFGAVRICI